MCDTYEKFILDNDGLGRLTQDRDNPQITINSLHRDETIFQMY